MPRKVQLDAGAAEEALRRYESGESMVSIASWLGVSGVTLRKYSRLWGWTPRTSGARTPAAAPRMAISEQTDTPRLAKRVEAAVRKQLSSIERRIGGDADPADAERDARVLASLVKSLTELARLDAARVGAGDRTAGAGGRKGTGGANEEHTSGSDPHAGPPRDLAELREELAARLRYLRAGRDPDCGDGEMVG